MSTSSTSPIAPARVQALLVPIGTITRARFDEFTARLYPESLVRLSDISPDGRPDRNMFSPLAFPRGVILFNLTTARTPETTEALSPFEVFRDTLVVIGIADGISHGIEALTDTMVEIGSQMNNVLLTHTFAFDIDDPPKLPVAVSCIPTKAHSRRTTIKTVMCDLSSRLLGELVLFARNIQNARTIDIPEPPTGSRNQDSTARPKSSLDTIGQFGRQSDDSRPGTPSSVSEAGTEHTVGTPSRLHRDVSNATTTGSRPGSPANGFGSSALNGGHSRPNSPQDWSTATGGRIRPLSSGELPNQVKIASATERTRNKLKGRQSVAIGSLYLLAGRWPDALRELADGAVRARAYGDHAWHAKGLENLLVTMLLLTWSGTDFTIPAVCLSSGDGTRQRRSASLSGSAARSRSSSTAQNPLLQSLSLLIPDLLHLICNTISRPITIYGDAMPQLPFSESIVRASYLLTYLHRDGGSLSIDTIAKMVLDSSGSKSTIQTGQEELSPISKREISSMLFRAYPTIPPASSAALFEAVIIFSGMISVLSFAGLHRKRAVLVKEMLSMMIPGLIQARKIGAAEVGIHPAASLAALHGLGEDGVGFNAAASDGVVERGLRTLMLQLCQAFGISLEDWSLPSVGADTEKETQPSMDSDEGMGDLVMKFEILRLCMNFSEALPNFKDVTHFAAKLLSLARPVSLPAVEDGVARANLGPDEQARLSTKIHRTLGVVKASDAEQLAAQYWDPFMVRGVQLCEPPLPKLLTERTRVDLNGNTRKNRAASITRQGPFIHDASLAVTQDVVKTQVTAAGQRSEFWVMLQNPYDFEVSIENIGLLTQGVEFEQRHQTVTLGPSRIQRTLVSGTAQAAGTLTINGVSIKVEGCSQQDFKIFEEAWYAKADTKFKAKGTDLGDAAQQRRPLSGESTESTKPAEPQAATGPAATTVSVKVTEAQPLCIMASHSLSQSIMTVLVGETQSFAVTIRNISESVPVTFAQLSFEHSLRAAVITEARGVAGQIQAYELRQAAAARPPLKWQNADTATQILPGQSASFVIEVYGLLGMTEGTVHIDYAHVSPDESQGAFYSRRVSFPFAITVGGSLEVQRFNVMPLSRLLKHISDSAEAANVLGRFKKVSERAESFVLLLDLRNAWSRPLTASLSVHDPDSPTSDVLTNLEESIPPGQNKRIAIPVPQLLVRDTSKAPTSGFSEPVQFVVSSDEDQQQSREFLLEQFWYRQALTKAVHGSWKEASGPRNGLLDFSALELTQEVIRCIKKSPVRVDMCIFDKQEIAQDATQAVRVSTHRPLRLNARITNNTSDTVSLTMQLVPSIALQRTEQWDISRRICWTGAFERRVLGLKPEENREIEWGFVAASSGRYMLELSVEERGKVKKEGRDYFGRRNQSLVLASASVTLIVEDE